MSGITLCDVVSLALEAHKNELNSFYFCGFIWEITETNYSYEIKATKETMVDIPSLLNGIGLAKSKSDAKRLMVSGAVYIDGNKITDFKKLIKENDLINKIVKVGRKCKKIIR